MLPLTSSRFYFPQHPHTSPCVSNCRVDAAHEVSSTLAPNVFSHVLQLGLDSLLGWPFVSSQSLLAQVKRPCQPGGMSYPSSTCNSLSSLRCWSPDFMPDCFKHAATPSTVSCDNGSGSLPPPATSVANFSTSFRLISLDDFDEAAQKLPFSSSVAFAKLTAEAAT